MEPSKYTLEYFGLKVKVGDYVLSASLPEPIEPQPSLDAFKIRIRSEKNRSQVGTLESLSEEVARELAVDQKLREWFEQECQRLFGRTADSRELWSALEAGVDEIKRTRKKWSELYAALEALPQLFIAV